ncbi:MAG: DNA repair exonuclease [Clostridia bacterium]|nr:DNA repair exonuclease [Clostridia bacterium]
MNKISFFHCADTHLDSPFSSLSSKPGLPALRRRQLLDTFMKMIDLAKSEKPDFLFIAGDLFEHEYARLATISAIDSAFAAIPGTRVVMIAGNHDPEAADSFYLTYKWSPNVYFLGESQESIFFEDKNTEVFGLGWGPGYGQKDRLETMVPDRGRINILLFHGDIDLDIGVRDYNSVPAAVLKAGGFDYVAAGHNHRLRESMGNGLIFNPGSLEPLGFDEPGKHGYFTGEAGVSQAPVVKFMEISRTMYETLEFDITGLSSDNEVIEGLKNKASGTDVLYRIILRGKRPVDYYPSVSLLESGLAKSILFARIVDESSADIALEDLSVMKGLKGAFVRNILGKIEKAGSDDERILLEKALHYGLEAIDNGKIETAGGEIL